MNLNLVVNNKSLDIPTFHREGQHTIGDFSPPVQEYAIIEELLYVLTVNTFFFSFLRKYQTKHFFIFI